MEHRELQLPETFIVLAQPGQMLLCHGGRFLSEWEQGEISDLYLEICLKKNKYDKLSSLGLAPPSTSESDKTVRFEFHGESLSDEVLEFLESAHSIERMLDDSFETFPLLLNLEHYDMVAVSDTP